MRLMRRRIMQAKACAHQRAKSCEATLCSFKIFEDKNRIMPRSVVYYRTVCIRERTDRCS